jgi:hypothetical protein
MTEMEGTVPMEEVVDATLTISEIPSEANAETIDGRTGYDGTGYGSIGEAIRTQVSDLWDGKAPAGHGLGGSGAYVDNLDTLKTTGVYTFTHSAVGNPFDGWGGIAVVTVSKTGVEQVLTCNTKGGVSCRRLLYLDSNKTAFEEWEWINPPMVLGTEYRTTKRHNGSAVYTKLVNLSTLPNKSSKTIAHNIVETARFVGLDVFAKNATNDLVQQFPFVNASGTVIAKAQVSADGVVVYSFDNLSGYTGHAILCYIKE